MTINQSVISKVLILCAFVAFLLVTIGASIFGIGGLQLVALGLMFWSAGALVA
jgi:hypothetical protein